MPGSRDDYYRPPKPRTPPLQQYNPYKPTTTLQQYTPAQYSSQPVEVPQRYRLPAPDPQGWGADAYKLQDYGGNAYDVREFGQNRYKIQNFGKNKYRLPSVKGAGKTAYMTKESAKGAPKYQRKESSKTFSYLDEPTYDYGSPYADYPIDYGGGGGGGGGGGYGAGYRPDWMTGLFQLNANR